MVTTKKAFAIIPVLFCTFCVLIAGAQADTYYISKATGNDSNPGTLESPWETTYKANQTLQAGDTVYFRAGTYNFTDTAINPTNTGTSGNLITFSAYNNEDVEFVNTSSSRIAYAINLNSDTGTVRSYIKIHGITFTDFNRHLWILRGSYNEISYCTFDGTLNTTGAGLDWRGSTIYREAHHNHIHHCTFKDYGAFDNNTDHGVLFEIGIDGSGTDDTEYNLIENNKFAHGGHHVLGIHGNHNVIRNNYLHNDAWWPTSDPQYGNRILYMVGYMPGSQRNLIEGNRIAYGGETSELDQIGGSGGTYSSPYNIVRKNMFYQCLIYGMFFYQYSGSGGGRYNKVYNNSYWYNGYSTIMFDKQNYDTAWTHAIFITDVAGSTNNNIFKNNIFYQNKNQRAASTPIIESWKADGDGGYNEPDLQVISNNWIGDIHGDPKFTSINGTPDPAQETQFNFTLQSDSGAINNGGFLTTITIASGSGTSFVVADAGYFMDGWGIIDGDTIQLDGQTKKARITNVNYTTNTITIDTSLTWTQGQGISLDYKGSAPDIGAYEFIQESAPISPTNLRIVN